MFCHRINSKSHHSNVFGNRNKHRIILQYISLSYIELGLLQIGLPQLQLRRSQHHNINMEYHLILTKMMYLGSKYTDLNQTECIIVVIDMVVNYAVLGLVQAALFEPKFHHFHQNVTSFTFHPIHHDFGSNTLIWTKTSAVWFTIISMTMVMHSFWFKSGYLNQSYTEFHEMWNLSYCDENDVTLVQICWLEPNKAQYSSPSYQLRW